jgi:hypothetical protein
MSTRTYAYADYGLLLDEEAAKLIYEQICGVTDYEDDAGYLLCDEGYCEYVGNFTGQAFHLNDNGGIMWNDFDEYDDYVIVYATVSNHPTLFNKAYDNMDDVIKDFKNRFGEYLPDDFNYRANIRQIIGTTWG